ncbi:MAG: cytochrome P450 [Halieaceae bacterium]|jgi:cytochrome P450 family 109|nr:cytochrome P450 [Halieaceae bacterium]
MSDTEEPVDAYQYYRYLRENTPVSRVDDGPWQIARYNDVLDVLRDEKTFSSDVSTRPPEDRRSPSMLFSDPPIHNRLRKLVSRAFKPSHIESQRILIESQSEKLVSAMCMNSRADLVQSLAAPLPVTVIAHMLGVADGDIQVFKQWSDAIFGNIADILFASPSPEAEAAGEEMDAYFLQRIEEIRRQPADHLLGRLIETETEDGHLTNAELLSFCSLLLIAGNETTTGLITASVRIFDEFPESFYQLKQSPQLIPGFIEEALRFYSPFSATVRRATRDTTIGDTEIGKGDLVLPLMASANRDQDIFDQADSFIIDRNPNPHVAFGFGVHFCLGAHLARLEGEIAVTSLTRQLESISLVEDDHSQMSVLGGPTELLVDFKPAA